MEQTGPKPLSGATLAITAVALALATFMQVLDTSIANVAVPTIAGDLGSSVSQSTWIITSFAVSNGISVPLTGWCMMRFGIVRTFVVSVVLFTMASFLCGAAWSLPSLIAFRILQGAVSGPMIPGSQALLLLVFPPQRRATALAIWSMTTLVAPITGPILGGYISDNVSWPWLFYINVPVGLLCAFLCWSNLAQMETQTRKMPIDKTGFILLTIWVGAFQIMLDTGKEADWFSSPLIVTEALVAIVAFIAWVIWEMNDRHPIVDLSLFRLSNFRLGVLAFGLGYSVFFGSSVLLPIWLQTQLGYPATWAGLVFAPAGVVAIVLTPLVARLLTRVDIRVLATISISMFSLSLYMRSLAPPDASFGVLLVPTLVQGIGMSGFFMSMVSLSLNGVPAHQIPQAASLNNFSRITAGAFGASLVTTFWDRGASLHQTRITEVMPGPGDGAWEAAMAQMRALGLDPAQSVGAINGVVTAQAYYLSTMDFFRICALLSMLMIPIIWMTSRVRPAAGAPAVAAAD
ncbi:MAG: DHA2 family efflux MFS transporter permease subunit [Hyphomonadaceae bacterium]